VPLIVAAAVVVAILVVVGAVLLTRGGDSRAAQDTTAAGTTTRTTTASPPTTTPATTAPVAPTGTEVDALRASLPADFRAGECTTADAAGDGDLAALACGASRSQPGPSLSSFYLYRDKGALEDVFTADVTRRHLSQFTDGQACPADQGYNNYKASDGHQAGRVACYVDEDDTAILIWTQDDARAEALIGIGKGGKDGVKTLWNWWIQGANSDFQV
jgi:serine/threonine-protein kinase